MEYHRMIESEKSDPTWAHISLCFKDDDGIDEAVNFWTPAEDDEGEQEKRLLECIKMWLRDTNEEFSD